MLRVDVNDTGTPAAKPAEKVRRLIFMTNPPPEEAQDNARRHEYEAQLAGNCAAKKWGRNQPFDCAPGGVGWIYWKLCLKVTPHSRGGPGLPCSRPKKPIRLSLPAKY